MAQPLRFIDMPPLWTALAVGLAYAQSRVVPIGPANHGLSDLIGGLLVGGGVILVVLAAIEFRRHRTSIIPHQVPTALITTGIFSRSRNPIYLADLMILTGLALNWSAWPSLGLTVILWWILQMRFVLPEEDRLRKQFPSAFDAYAGRTRRWI